MAVDRFGVYLVDLDPTIGSEIRKVRPCLIVSPNEMNRRLRTAIVAPMTTQGKGYPTRVACRFAGKRGEIALDQMRAVDQARLMKRMGRIDPPTGARVLDVLREMFEP